jgi:glycosyltransferase involved in cell wall biosynthesis
MHTLNRVYESLLEQTILEFEWLIVDDGSKDKTEDLIGNWKKKAPFLIRYYKKENGGKISAIKEGINRTKSELFLIADSDDRFEKNTIEVFLKHYDNIPETEKKYFSGVSCLCKYADSGEIVGNSYPYSPMISNVIEIEYKYNVYGEKWGILRTDVLKEYFCFKLSKEIKFISESYFWFQIANNYKTVFVNEILRTYYRGTTDSLSSPFTTERHPKGVYISEEMALISTVKYYHLKPITTLSRVLRLSYAAQKSGINLKEAINEKKGLLKTLIIFLWPFGSFIKFIRRIQYKKNNK